MYSSKELIDFIDDLCRGFDPYTGEELPSDHLLNNPSSIRKLFTIKEILKDYAEVEVERLEKQAKVERKLAKANQIPFAYASQMDSAIESAPCALSNLIERINELKPDNMKKLGFKEVSAILIKEGILCVDEYAKKVPTEKGFELGLSISHRMSAGKSYDVVVYNYDAQGYVIDLLKRI